MFKMNAYKCFETYIKNECLPKNSKNKKEKMEKTAEESKKSRRIR